MELTALSLNVAEGLNPPDQQQRALLNAQPANPFVGLRPFESTESLLFFGRREQTIELLKQLHRTHFLAVVGSSGCGKSSLIRAGLIPKLKAGFVTERRVRWSVAIMKPGDAPLQNLARAISEVSADAQAGEAAGTLLNEIRGAGVRALLDHLAPLLKDSDVNLLLLVDQFEEIFRFNRYNETDEQSEPCPQKEQQRDEATEFVRLMLALVAQRELPIYVVMTMRSDFLGDCDAFYGRPEAMNQTQYLVPRLTRQLCHEAIEGPVRLFGQTVAPRLVDRVLNDVGEESDQLPVMQHALMRTWDEWRREGHGPLDLPHYEAAGTYKDALSKDAENALKGMSDEELWITKRLFQSLTDTDAGGRRVRRPVHLSEVEASTGASRAKLMEIIDHFRGQRSFLTVAESEVKDDPLIDISHESLIRQWKTLRDWADEEARSRATYLRVVDAALRRQQRQAKLWGNPDLQLALNWRAQAKPNEAWSRRYNPPENSATAFHSAMKFLDQSKQQRLRVLLLYCLLLLTGIVLLAGFARSRQQVLIAEAREAAEMTQQQEESKHKEELTSLMVSEAEQRRIFAEAAQKESDKAREAAEKQGQFAVQQEREAERQKQMAEAQRRDAEKQRLLAILKSQEANQQRELALVRLEELNREKEQLALQSTKLETQLILTREARDEAARERDQAAKERDAAMMAMNQEKGLRQAAQDALRQRDEEQKEKEKAQQQVAQLEKERREREERIEAYRRGDAVTYHHPLLGNIQYRKLANGGMELLDNWVEKNIMTAEIPELKGIPNSSGEPEGTIRFYRCGVAQLQAAFREIKERGFFDRILSLDRTFVDST